MAAIFFAVTFFALFLHMGKLVNYGFPFFAALISAWLCAKKRGPYIAFVWWLWLLSPEIRRLVDFEIGFQSVSPVMLAPFLASGTSLITTIRRIHWLNRKPYFPFALLLIGLLYAFLIGLLRNGLTPALFDLLNYVGPLLFGMHVALLPERHAELRRDLQSVFSSSLVILGGYGIFQFFHLPPWDAYWMHSTATVLTSIGRARAEDFRIFGPLNSSGPYAIALMALLIYFFSMHGIRKWLGGAFAFPAFLLTLVRSAWGGWLIGFVYVLSRARRRDALRFALVFAAIALLAWPLLSGPVASTFLTNRLQTFHHLTTDSSFEARRQFYISFLETALSEIIGRGLGGAGLAQKLAAGAQAVNFDSGLMLIPYEFGWVGAMSFLAGLVWLGIRVFHATKFEDDPLIRAAAGVFFASLSQLVFFNVFGGVSGMIAWLAAGLVTSTHASPRRAQSANRPG